ncbi:MAG: Mov34/MPN/PAD-1 family protein [Archangium sp.]|nr:Mov34/MPN/PAD-1 family protein [Archangium sp.]
MVTLTTEALNTMRAHAERAFPEECVGALLRDGQVRPLENAAIDRRVAFSISAGDYLALEREGVGVAGFYHSHPDGPAVPSVADARSANEAFLTLIIPVIGGVAAAPRAFRFADDRFIEVLP